jgi:hypothetical protein
LYNWWFDWLACLQCVQPPLSGTCPLLTSPPWPLRHVPLSPAGGGNQRDKGGAVAIRQSYLRVVGFQEDVLNGDTARRPTFT